MSVELTDREHQIIQQLILDRWNPHRINKKIANHHGLTINQVKYMRSKPAFKAEHDKQLAIYLDSFDDIQLADRKERVKAMAGLYEKIPNPPGGVEAESTEGDSGGSGGRPAHPGRAPSPRGHRPQSPAPCLYLRRVGRTEQADGPCCGRSSGASAGYRGSADGWVVEVDSPGRGGPANAARFFRLPSWHPARFRKSERLIWDTSAVILSEMSRPILPDSVATSIKTALTYPHTNDNITTR